MKAKDSIRLPDNTRLVLHHGPGWQDSYLEILIMPLLEGAAPSFATQVTSSQNSECWRAEVGGSSLFIKFFHFRDIFDRFPMLRKSRAERALNGGELLLAKGFSTPELIAQGNVMRAYRTVKCFLITGDLGGSFNVYDYLNKFPVAGQTAEVILKKRTLLKTAGKLIGNLHKNGIFHGDLRPGNILIDHQNAGNTPRLYFIDNERNRYFRRGIPPRLRLKNLVQINMIVMPQITFTDRLRFFYAYLSENPELAPHAKDWIRRTFLRTKERLTEKIPGIWSDF